MVEKARQEAELSMCRQGWDVWTNVSRLCPYMPYVASADLVQGNR